MRMSKSTPILPILYQHAATINMDQSKFARSPQCDCNTIAQRHLGVVFASTANFKQMVRKLRVWISFESQLPRLFPKSFCYALECQSRKHPDMALCRLSTKALPPNRDSPPERKLIPTLDKPQAFSLAHFWRVFLHNLTPIRLFNVRLIVLHLAESCICKTCCPLRKTQLAGF